MANNNPAQKIAAQEAARKAEKRDINTSIIFWSFLVLFADALLFTFSGWKGVAWFFGSLFGAPEVWKTIFYMLGAVLGIGPLCAGLYATKQVQ